MCIRDSCLELIATDVALIAARGKFGRAARVAALRPDQCAHRLTARRRLRGSCGSRHVHGGLFMAEHRFLRVGGRVTERDLLDVGALLLSRQVGCVRAPRRHAPVLALCESTGAHPVRFVPRQLVLCQRRPTLVKLVRRE
eukprot:985414-Prymnesium_polylepis.1